MNQFKRCGMMWLFVAAEVRGAQAQTLPNTPLRTVKSAFAVEIYRPAQSVR